MALANILTSLPLPVGSRIVAVRNFGPVKAGEGGIITDTVELPSLWKSRPMYLCLFANNLRIAARPGEIALADRQESARRVRGARLLTAPKRLSPI